MIRRIHRIILLFALLIGSAGMNYVQAANVTLTVTASPAAGGQVRIANGSWTTSTNGTTSRSVPQSTPMSISAQAASGYTFSQWNDGNKNATRAVQITKNTTYTATFIPNTVTLTVTSNNTNYGTVTGGGTYNYGTSVTIKATPKTGYHFVQWSDGNTTASRSITATANASYQATFAVNTYTLTVSSNNTNYGTVTGGGTYNHGATATLKATAKTGYHFVKWSDNNTNASRSITVTAAATYTATFAINTYTITATSANTSMGTVNGGGTYNYGASATLTATPKTGYHFVKWSDNVTSATRTISNIKANATYTATFAINTYTITFKNGNTTLQTLTVNHGVKPSYTGSTPTKAQTAQYTYTFSGWSPTIAAATKDQTYTAQFTSTVRKYTITVASNNNEMGYAQMTYIDPVSQGTSTYANTSHAFNYGDQLTLRAYPSDCAHFVKWSDNSTEKTRTVTVTGTKTYTATFAADTYSGTCGATGNEANVQWSLNMCTGALSITGTGDMMNYSGTDTPWYPYRGFITSVTISNSVTSIGNCAFYYCSNMKSVSMGTGVTSIGDYAFYECNNLTSITIGNHVTSIGSRAFLNCSRLTSITIPPSVTSIRSYAFSGCYAMESLYITNLAAWCNITFDGTSASPFYRNDVTAHIGGGNLYVNGTKVTTLTIPNGITEIPNYAFFGFAGVTSIQFNQATSIGNFAFACCHGLTNVTIPSGVTTIGNNSFAYCTHLLSMSIPASAISIGIDMMYNCQAQTDIYAHWTENVPAWPSSFTSKSPQSSITLHVPTCTQTLYTGGWANYTIDGETEDRAVSIASNNATYGLVQYNDETPIALIDKQVPCTTTFAVTAVPAEGCHFVEWSDGLLQGTRQLGNLESDTALIALFGPGVPPEIYDDQVGFTQQGALSGAFSVSATQVVYFSQGPLQFNASLGTHECADGTTKPGTWRFAEHQYDVVGDLNAGNVYENDVKCSNTLASATYTGWQDMYCWGASGYNGIEPYKANRPSTTSIAGTNYDWGVYNAISNGGNTPGLWRTPTRTEWDYMFNVRPNAKQLNAPAMVEGMYGLVVLPDDYWDSPAGINLVTNSTQYYTDNVFTAAQWAQLEAAGAVFIPSGGWFAWSSNTWVSNFRNTGELWASTGSSTSSQHDVQWGNDKQAYMSSSGNHVMQQLRLVSDVGGYAQVRFVGTDSHGDKFVIAYIYVPYGATPVPPEVPERECYTFAGWDRTITPVAGHVTTYTAVYETDLFTVTVMTDDSSMGLVQIGTAAEQASFTEQFNCGEEITITAIPANGYAFDQWSDNSYQASRTITLTSDTTLKAIFRSTVYPTEHGALPGVFSVSDTKKVVFSQGNLQFNAALGTHQCSDRTTKTGTWRFAENQYDFVGDNTQGNVYYNDEKCSNERVSNSYNGWIDYFNHGNTGYNKSPTSYTTAYGTNFNSPSVYDWGSYVAISNGGNMPGYIVNGWIVLQRFQWYYLFNSRANAQDLRSLATVNDVLGCILLPDDWQLPSGIVFTPDESSYATNSYTREQWNRMEQAGAVFLPAAGRRAYDSNGSPQLSYPEIQTTGYVWSSSGIGNQGAAVAMSFGIDNFELKSFYQGTNYDGVSVRLVHYVSSYHIIFRGYKDGEENVVLQDKLVAEGAMPIPPEVPEDDCRTFIGWDRVIEPASGDTEYIAQYELKGPFTVTVQSANPEMGDVSIIVN